MKFLTLIICFLHQITIYACDKKSIIVAWENYPPYQIGDNSSVETPKGISIDLFLAAAKKINCLKNIKFDYFPWKRALFELEKGHVDIMFNARKVPDREKYAFYKKYYSKSRNAIFVNSEDYDKLLNLSLENIMNLKNFTIGYSNGYSYGDLFENMKTKHPEKFEMALHDDLSIIKATKKRVNAFIGDAILTKELIKELKKNNKIDKKINFKALPAELAKIPPFSYFIYSKKSVPEKLVQKFDEALSQLYDEGATKEIFLKYISSSDVDLILVKPDYGI